MMSVVASSNPAVQAAAAMQRPKLRFAIEFEYMGATKLMVTGPITGKSYEFDKPGARALVDVRDMPSVQQVPNLRRVG
jgi:hypothetical protein